MSGDQRRRLVYSTDRGAACPRCGWPVARCACAARGAGGDEPVPSNVVARLRIEKQGRRGKTVTVVDGLPRNAEFLRELAQELKRGCGVGGTVREDGIEVQGDQRERVRGILLAKGLEIRR